MKFYIYLLENSLKPQCANIEQFTLQIILYKMGGGQNSIINAAIICMQKKQKQKQNG